MSRILLCSSSRASCSSGYHPLSRNVALRQIFSDFRQRSLQHFYPIQGVWISRPHTKDCCLVSTRNSRFWLPSVLATFTDRPSCSAEDSWLNTINSPAKRGRNCKSIFDAAAKTAHESNNSEYFLCDAKNSSSYGENCKTWSC